MNNTCNTTIDWNSKKVVIINDITFQSRRGIDWKKVEDYLKRSIGKSFEIAETSEKIYIDTDFPDEFSHSNDTKKLKGANMKAKANLISAIGDLIQTATDLTSYPDYNKKHGSKAKLGWHRYTIYFGIPVYDEQENLKRYNIFSGRMLIRCDENRKQYLYDIVRIKKETSRPLEQ